MPDTVEDSDIVQDSSLLEHDVLYGGILLLKQQQLVVTRRYTVLQETETTWPILSRPTIKHVIFFFLRNRKDTEFLFSFYGHNPTV